ncbi:MAG TPA: endonuclease/exonuclease/phosphatase family protein [Nitrospira sp.]|nr:endonuclease/exonuclease/phosphatase family protein [Nitrospira sp.]
MIVFLLGLLAWSSTMTLAAEREDPVRPLRVVTYNLLHDGASSGFLDGRTHLEERLDMAIRELKALDPDIVAVQEASDSRTHGNVPERLAGALGFHMVFEPATEHVFGLWPLDWLVVGVIGFKEGSAILSRFPITASGVHTLPRCKKWLEPRIMLQATLDTLWGPLEIFSTHTGSGDECQMERVGEIVRDGRGTGPSLLMGDFNTPDTSKVLTTLRNEAGFIDVFRTVNPEMNGATVWQRIESPLPTVSRRVDFILLLNGSESAAFVRSSRIVLDRPGQLPDGSTLWPSDHYGVLADLDIVFNHRSR